MKRRLVFLISLLLTAAVLVVIFGFSAQPASESDGVSRALAKLLLAKLPWLKAKFTVSQLNRLLRKLAHFTLYFILGCGLTGLLRFSRNGAVLLLAVPLGALCAALDEWHQAFVPGRGPGLRDVVLDTCGVITAVGLISLLLLLRERRRKRKE